MQLQCGIGQNSADSKLGQSRPQRPQQHLLVAAATNDKATDQDAVSRQHFHSGRDVEQLNRRRNPDVVDVLFAIKSG